MFIRIFTYITPMLPQSYVNITSILRQRYAGGTPSYRYFAPTISREPQYYLDIVFLLWSGRGLGGNRGKEEMERTHAREFRTCDWLQSVDVPHELADVLAVLLLTLQCVSRPLAPGAWCWRIIVSAAPTAVEAMPDLLMNTIKQKNTRRGQTLLSEDELKALRSVEEATTF